MSVIGGIADSDRSPADIDSEPEWTIDQASALLQVGLCQQLIQPDDAAVTFFAPSGIRTNDRTETGYCRLRGNTISATLFRNQVDDYWLVDPAGNPGRSILDNGFGWIRGVRIPCIQPDCWHGREPGDYPRMCVAFERERSRRQGGVPDVLQLDARATRASAGETQVRHKRCHSGQCGGLKNRSWQ